jgi:hypothetical protein
VLVLDKSANKVEKEESVFTALYDHYQAVGIHPYIELEGLCRTESAD